MVPTGFSKQFLFGSGQWSSRNPLGIFPMINTVMFLITQPETTSSSRKRFGFLKVSGLETPSLQAVKLNDEVVFCEVVSSYSISFVSSSSESRWWRKVFASKQRVPLLLRWYLGFQGARFVFGDVSNLKSPHRQHCVLSLLLLLYFTPIHFVLNSFWHNKSLCTMRVYAHSSKQGTLLL